MNTQDIKRKLTAILHADVKGYSRLMGEDEVTTLQTLSEYLEIMTVIIKQCSGRVVGTEGDAILADFVSVVDAVVCAVEIQKELKPRNKKLPDNRKLEFRIGINLGDVIEKDDDIFGDGVNIAARVEALANGGGICISGTVYNHIQNKLDLRYKYIGEHTVKNIAKPVRVYRVLIETGTTYVEQSAAPELPDIPSIAVLPFNNMSGDPEQEYFSDGITEELITALAKLEKLKVISRTSAFYFKGKDMDLRTIGEKLNVENVLEGSVRKAGNKLRITAQLIKVADDTHLWAETYDRELKNIFEIQDEVTKSIVDKLRVRLMGKEDPQLVKPTTENMEAFELYLKANLQAKSIPRSLSPSTEIADIVDLYKKVIELDPNFVPAYVELAEHLALGPWGQFELQSLQDEAFLKAKEYTEKALKLNSTNAKAHVNFAIIKWLEWDWDGAEKELKRAIELNPGSFQPHMAYARYLGVMGRHDEGLNEAMKSMELDPLAQHANIEYGEALERTGQFEQAIEQFKKVVEMFPQQLAPKTMLAKIYEWNGMHDEAMVLYQEAGGKIGTMMCYARMGKRKDAQKILDELEKERNEPIFDAMINVIFHEKDKAIELLEQAVEEHHPQCELIIANPGFDNLRSDSRFIALLKKMGIEG